jgi:feruloyl-CoA synthase
MDTLTEWRSASLRPITLAPRGVRFERRPKGELLLASPLEVSSPVSNLCSYLRHWGETAPERPFIRQRTGCWSSSEGVRPWRTLSYGAALQGARSIAQSLLDRGYDQERPILVLSGNSIEHALLALGAFFAGVPISPLSPAYSLLSKDFVKLRAIVDLLDPAMVFAQSGARFEPALRMIHLLKGSRTEMLLAEDCITALPCTQLADLLEAMPSEAVERRTQSLDADTIAKLLFTSGSTGMPKAVPNTHGMMCANQQMMALIVPPDPENPPVLVDWLPWCHTFGGNVTFNWVLRDGGVLNLDSGQPLSGAFAESLANLREISPTHYFNVPSGYAMLADALEQDEKLCEAFFRRLVFCFYGGSGLPQRTWDRMQALAVATTGQRIIFTTGCGSTETGPIATFLHWQVDGPGIIGLPVPGVTAKLVPTGAHYEMRLKGENIFRGYYRRPDLSEAAFDEEGFYRTGDAVRLLEDADPSAGLVFEGRTSENFKLATGTFVQVGQVRLAVLSAVPLLKDAVVVGPDRPWLGLLAWLDEAACRRVACDSHASVEELVADAEVIAALERQFSAYNAGAGGSSQRIRRIRLLVSPPSMDAGEMTEKGYLNQKAVLARRAGEAELLYADIECCEERRVVDLTGEPAGISTPRAS